MTKPSISKNKSRYKQGSFIPKNPQKYIGNPSGIVYRSSWELAFLRYCDQNPTIVSYASEEVVIQYVSPLDGKIHRYFIDFYINVRQSDGSTKKFLVEIKPFAQTRPPKKPKVMSEYFNDALKTYWINQAKWNAAREFSRRYGMEFCVITEKELFRGKSK